MSELTSQLSLYGVNIATTMERFIDDEEFYFDCLNILLEDLEFQNLGEELTAKNYKNAYNSAHTLKGTIGNLGLTPMFEIASTIVQQLKSNNYNDLDILYKKLLKEKSKIEDIIKNCK